MLVTASQIDMDMGGHYPAQRKRGNIRTSIGTANLHRRRSITSNITSNVTGLTSNITSSIASNITSNLTGRTPTQNFNANSTKKTATRRGSVDCRRDSQQSVPPAGSQGHLTMNHLLKGKTALTSKTKRVVARGLVAVPPASKKKVNKMMGNNTKNILTFEY